MNLEEYLLAKVSEEAGEIVKVVAKGQEHGLDDTNPMNNTMNMTDLAMEYLDLQAQMAMLADYLTYKKVSHPYTTTLELEARKVAGFHNMVRKMCKAAFYAMHSVQRNRLHLEPTDVEFMRQYFVGENLDIQRRYVGNVVTDISLTPKQLGNYSNILSAVQETVKSLYSIDIV